MSANDKLYTWRNLVNPFEDGVPFEIVWRWSDWVHQRKHLQEPEYSTILNKSFPPNVVTGLKNVFSARSADKARSALQRLAEVLRQDLHDELATPRVLTCVTMPDDRLSLIFVGSSGLRFITSTSKSELQQVYFNNLYFGRWLANESLNRRFRQTATDHHVAIRELVAKHTKGKYLLPDPADPHCFLERPGKQDHNIHFIKAVHWGFKDDKPGSRWVGFTRAPRPAGDPVKLDPLPKRPNVKDDKP